VSTGNLGLASVSASDLNKTKLGINIGKFGELDLKFNILIEQQKINFPQKTQ